MLTLEEKRRAKLASPGYAVSVAEAAANGLFTLYSHVVTKTPGFTGAERFNVTGRPAVIYDLTGIPLFYDFPLYAGRAVSGFVRTAANRAVGEGTVAVQLTAASWDLPAARTALTNLAEKKYRGGKVGAPKLVCYSYPRVGLYADVVGKDGKSRPLLVDAATAEEIPVKEVPREESGKGVYSYLAAISEAEDAARARRWAKETEGVTALFKKRRKLSGENVFQMSVIDRYDFLKKELIALDVIPFYTSATLDYCCHAGGDRDHACFALHPQENSVHCTRASSQMVLCYYRYCYSQHDVAQAFGVADTALTPWSAVAPGLESLTHKCFTVVRNSAFTWTDCVNEISNRRPFLSDNGGHTRACAGTKQQNIYLIGQTQGRWLYIFDPWSPGVGAVYWENFNATYYAWMCTLVRKTTNHV